MLGKHPFADTAQTFRFHTQKGSNVLHRYMVDDTRVIFDHLFISLLSS
jgi:hypothetical protein